MLEILRVLLAGIDNAYPLMKSPMPMYSFCLSLALCPLVWWWFNQNTFGEKHPRKYFWLSFLFVILLQWVFQLLPERSTGSMVQHEMANSFYTVAQKYPLRDYLANYSAVRRTLPLHATSNMPGKAMLYYGLGLFGDHPRLFAALILLLSNLGGVFIYSISMRLFQNRNAAFASAVLYWLCPAKIYFFPLLNIVSPTILLGSLYCMLRAVESGAWRWIILVGLSFFVLFMFEPLPLVCGLFHIWILGAAWIRKKLTSLQIVRVGLGALLFFSLSIQLFGVATGFWSIPRFLELVAVNAHYYSGYRSIDWFFRNFFDFSIGLGYASLLVLLYGSFTLRLADTVAFRNAKGYAITFAATLLILNASGVNREEIPRLWIFMLAMLYPLVGFYLVKMSKRHLLPYVAAAHSLQTAIALHYIGYVWWP